MVQSAGPVGLVTGAANGIGRAIAHELLASGWRLGLVDLRGTKLVRRFAKQARSVAIIEGDVAEESTAQRAIAITRGRFGRLDGLVANAGTAQNKPLSKLTLPEWRRVIDVNLTAAFLFARAGEQTLAAEHGAIVIIASSRALMSEANTEAYSASKGGLVALTHALSISLGPHVRVNCVSPGWIVTKNPGALRRQDHMQHPVGRVGKPQDVAEMVRFLLDREKSGFITGANFLVDGGMTHKMIYVD